MAEPTPNADNPKTSKTQPYDFYLMAYSRAICGSPGAYSAPNDDTVEPITTEARAAVALGYTDGHSRSLCSLRTLRARIADLLFSNHNTTEEP